MVTMASVLSGSFILRQMNWMRHWIANYPEPQKEAILEAIASSSLARIRHALRLMEELGPTKRGPAFRVELLGTYSLEPLRPVLQLALNCFPAQAELRIGPLDSIETQISQPVRVAKEELLHARVVLWRAEECFLKSFILFPMGFPKVLHLAAINYLGGLKVSFACISEARVKFHYSFRLFSRSSSRIRSSRHNIARVCFRCLERSIKRSTTSPQTTAESMSLTLRPGRREKGGAMNQSGWISWRGSRSAQPVR